jgi:RNA polymerase sigma-70 factor (ECF subfamily)
VDTSDDPRLGADRDEALKLAVPPAERAAYVLREAFDYSYCQIAEILRTVEANVRQLVSRARKHVEEGRRTTVSAAERERLFAAFLDAARRGT